MRVAEFSPCRRWRYTLWRDLDADMFAPHGDKYLMVIGLNPSTADETHDDPTIRRCIGFARSWGYGRLCMTNLFAWRDTQPAAMKAAAAEGIDVIGADNDQWLQACAAGAGLIVAAWGNDGPFLGRSAQVRGLLQPQAAKLRCFRLTGIGEPEHPLYLPGAILPVPF